MKKTTTSATANTNSASTDASEDQHEIRQRNARRAERAQKIAQMQKTGHPFAAAAMAQHQKVVALEDQLNAERGMLMGILKHVKL